MPKTIAIIGAGLAGAKAAEAARKSGFDGRLVLIGDEPHLPYERPPLSKAVLRGEADVTSARVHPETFYVDHSIEVVTGCTVERLDPAGTVHLADGESIPFDTAVLATGAAPRRLDIAGAELGNIHYLRTCGDSIALRDRIRGATRVAVVGAGWIGSEVAASARQMGADVVLIDPGPVPLHGVLGERVGRAFAQLHADHGVKLRMGAGVDGFEGSGSVEEVALVGGGSESADLVVVGIGVIPNVGLAQAAGLHVDDGVVVDSRLRTSASSVFAAGDIANVAYPEFGRLRVEHWDTAVHQGETAGRNAAGAYEAYTRVPYFFSDQYDLGMEYIGHAGRHDAVTIRGEIDEREFVAFWQRDGFVTAAMHVNVWDSTDDLRRLVASDRTVLPSRLSDPQVPLAGL